MTLQATQVRERGISLKSSEVTPDVSTGGTIAIFQPSGMRPADMKEVSMANMGSARLGTRVLLRADERRYGPHVIEVLKKYVFLTVWFGKAT